MLTGFEAKALVELTTSIYENVCRDLDLDPVQVRRMYLMPSKHREVIEAVGKAYIEDVCQLDHRFLELILMSHEQGHTKRTQPTLSAIQAELIERGLLNEGED